MRDDRDPYPYYVLGAFAVLYLAYLWIKHQLRQ